MSACGCGRELSDSPTSIQAGENYYNATITRVRLLLAAQAGDAKASRLVAEGQRHCEQLHAVAHDPGHPGVNYLAIGKWLRKSLKRVDRAGISESQALDFMDAKIP